MQRITLDMYEEIQSEIVSTKRFDEKSDLSMTYLGRSDKMKKMTNCRRIIPHNRKQVYIRQIIGWNRVSITVRYKCK